MNGDLEDKLRTADVFFASWLGEIKGISILAIVGHGRCTIYFDCPAADKRSLQVEYDNSPFAPFVTRYSRLMDIIKDR